MSGAWRCPRCHRELAADTPELQYYQRIMENGGTITGGWGVCPICGGKFRIPEAWQGDHAMGHKRVIVFVAIAALAAVLAVILWLVLR